MVPWLTGLAGAVLAATVCLGTRMWAHEVLRRRVIGVFHGNVYSEWFESFDRLFEVAAGQEARFGVDADSAMYLVVGGALRLHESGHVLGPGELLTRADAAVALADARLLGMSPPEILEAYARYPEFGAFLLTLLTNRLFERRQGTDNVTRFADHERRRRTAQRD